MTISQNLPKSLASVPLLAYSIPGVCPYICRWPIFSVSSILEAPSYDIPYLLARQIFTDPDPLGDIDPPKDNFWQALFIQEPLSSWVEEFGALQKVG